MSNPITIENQNTGSTGWQFPSGKVATTQIQAYANTTSLDPGQTINFYVSTQSGGTSYTLNIYRLGYYSGTGGCLKYTSSGRTGVAQGYWDGTTLQNCPTLIYDSTTHLTEAGWTSTDSWSVPSNACTGMYAAMFTDANGYQTGTIFTVRGNSNAEYVYIHGYCTDAAYNFWGAYSLYSAPQGYKVSFNRPDNYNGGMHGTYLYEIPGIQWLESQGYNIAYLSDIDVHATSGILNTHQAVLIGGHDEYWTYERRAATEAAVANGLGMAFLGANDCYWQIRMDVDAANNANRTVIGYKVLTASSNLSTDPLYGVNNAKVSTQWRDPVLNRPENALCGIMFSSYVTYTANSNFPWTVDASATSQYLTASGLVDGTSYGTDLVGNEWDNIHSGGPNNIQVIGTSAVTDINSKADISQTTTYVASGGGLVFASGSICWTWGLASYRWDGLTPAPIPGMQSLMSNIMRALIRPKSPTGFSAFSAHR